MRPLSTGVSCPVAEEKIARVSGAELDLFEHALTLEIRGTYDERKRAKKCVGLGYRAVLILRGNICAQVC